MKLLIHTNGFVVAFLFLCCFEFVVFALQDRSDLDIEDRKTPPNRSKFAQNFPSSIFFLNLTLVKELQ
jgi:hypothetical protein